MSLGRCFLLSCVALVVGACATIDPRELVDCTTYAIEGFRPIADQRTERFLGKVEKDTARCRGGNNAVAGRDRPWVDWQNYWATGDAASRAPRLFDWILGPNRRGIRGALLDLEYQRMEMIKFNLFDNSGTYEKYVTVLRDPAGVFNDPWVQMRVPDDNPHYNSLTERGLREHKGRTKDRDYQECTGELLRFREVEGYCNDLYNPLMGSTNQPFARNVQFDAVTFLDLKEEEKSQETRNRHGKRLELLRPDPQLISRKLFSRDQKQTGDCREEANCPYEKADWFNVLAAFWIQFMTHDWFSHLDEGSNGEPMEMGCAEKQEKERDTSDKVIWRYKALSQLEIEALKCRPHDRIGKALFDKDNFPNTNEKPIDKQGNAIEEEKQYFTHEGGKYLTRAHKTTLNKVTAWWDASQIYGYDEDSKLRVKRVKVLSSCVPHSDVPKAEQVKCQVELLNGAKLLMEDRPNSEGEKQGYLPVLDGSDAKRALQWVGQEATGFPDNWSIGLSLFHNIFAREHNDFIEHFKGKVLAAPTADSGLEDPGHPERAPILYQDVTPDELFQVARLVVSAEIAKIHTIEWTTQLLYNEALNKGMNANWFGLAENYPAVSDALEAAMSRLKQSGDLTKANFKYSAFAGGPGIFGLGNEIKDCWHFVFCPDEWKLTNPNHVNGGTHHFGSPFNFPEEFITVYRLHPMVPDLLEYREVSKPDKIIQIPVIETFRKKATTVMRKTGLANWALSMGRQPLGRLTLFNHPQFLQNLTIAEGQQIDVAALDIIRDRERGVPRFNEFRRQYGLTSLTSFDDFIDKNLKELSQKNPEKKRELERQQKIANTLREVYGTHSCDGSTITTAQKRWIQTSGGGKWVPIDDCFGQEYGTEVDNIEDLDTVVGWLAEPVRPHGFAISETQFQVFILNASRRLFSDRFFTSSFRPEFYSHLGVEWITNNGPAGECGKKGWLYGFEVDRSPLKCVLRRTIPELNHELEHVVNVFDPWSRDRGEYYSLQ